MKKPSDAYLEQARNLTQEQAEQLFSRMRGKLNRRLEDRNLDALEAVALQLEMEDEKLQEWRKRWAEISARENRKREK